MLYGTSHYFLFIYFSCHFFMLYVENRHKKLNSHHRSHQLLWTTTFAIGEHSHHDIGNYIISIYSMQLSGDPGGPMYYDANTFNSWHYNSPLVNFYGHPVPLVNGNLQKWAVNLLRRKVKPKVSSSPLTDSIDEIIFDMTSGAWQPLWHLHVSHIEK